MLVTTVFQTNAIFSFSNVAFLQDLAGAQFVAAVDDGDFGGKAGEEEPLFQGAVAAADHDDFFAAEEEAIAGAAIADAAAGQFLFAGDAQLAWEWRRWR